MRDQYIITGGRVLTPAPAWLLDSPDCPAELKAATVAVDEAEESLADASRTVREARETLAAYKAARELAARTDRDAPSVEEGDRLDLAVRQAEAAQSRSSTAATTAVVAYARTLDKSLDALRTAAASTVLEAHREAVGALDALHAALAKRRAAQAFAGLVKGVYAETSPGWLRNGYGEQADHLMSQKVSTYPVELYERLAAGDVDVLADVDSRASARALADANERRMRAAHTNPNQVQYAGAYGTYRH
jgi:hypothetical protein